MPCISLAELRSFAAENSGTDFDVTSVHNCLACQMLKERFAGAGVQWIATGDSSTDEIHNSYVRVHTTGMNGVEHRYGIPESYIDWCVSVQDALDNAYVSNGEKVPQNWFSGAELVRIIDKLSQK